MPDHSLDPPWRECLLSALVRLGNISAMGRRAGARALRAVDHLAAK